MNLSDYYHNADQPTRLKIAGVIIALLVLAIGYSGLNDKIVAMKKKRAGREVALAEMMLLNQRYKVASSDAQRLGNRLAAVKPDDSPAKLMDEIGIRGKGIQIKPVKGEERAGGIEDAAEVRIEGITANEAVNLLHRLEKGARPITFKKATLKTRYDDPAKLDLTFTMALLKPLPPEKR